MSKLIHLVLLYGGRSGEHEISLISAAPVLRNLNKESYRIFPVAMDKEGQFHLHQYEDLLDCAEKLPVKTERSKPLDGFLKKGRLGDVPIDVVFPMAHGPLYEDGCLQGMLKLSDVAFVGSDVLSSSLGMDKDMARRIVCRDGLSCARYRLLSWCTSSAERQGFCNEVVREFGLPLFVKPCSMGSSVGIHKVKSKEELSTAIEDAFRYDDEIVVEEYIQGREIELAVLENTESVLHPRVSLAGEIRVHHEDGFYSYSAKYIESEKTELIVPASLNASLEARLKKAAADAFIRLKCRGMARVDFFVDESQDKLYFSEINTLPGFTPISMYPKLWQASGLSYPDLLDELITVALNHHHRRQQLVTNYL